MPALKSKNRFPSTSSTIAPRPVLATSGYARVYEGEIYWRSLSMILRAFGPGNSVWIFGSFSLVTCDAIACPPAYLRSARHDRAIPGESCPTSQNLDFGAPRFSSRPALGSLHHLARVVPSAE